MPLNPSMHLAPGLFNTGKLKQIPTRNGYGEGLVEAGKKDPRIVALCADLTDSTRTEYFKKAFPERFIEIGVAEQNLVTVAAGMAAAGKVPFLASYGTFNPGRNWEQIRTTVAYNDQNVKIAGAHCGVSVGPDGATHQMTEDLAILRAIPKMRISVPCDAIQTQKTTVAMAKRVGPDYLRFAREATPVFTTKRTPYRFGKADEYYRGTDVVIFACGPLVYDALCAAEQLKKELAVRVMNVHTIKPLDDDAIVRAVKACGAVVTVEEATVKGGLGGAVAELLAKTVPTPMEFIGMQDVFGQSGKPSELLAHYGMTTENIKQAVRMVFKRKQK